MEPILPDPDARTPPALADPDARDPPALADHLLEEILVRIDAPADLIRASAACKAFRLVITDPNFLHRYRSLHPPILLGFACSSFPFGFLPVVAPHLNAPAALAFAGAASFSFDDYLPDLGGGWYLCHSGQVRNGRVLLTSGCVLPQIAVCDPLTQEYTLLPAIPDSLLAIHTQHEVIIYANPFFDPSVSYNEVQYRVMCWTFGETMGAMFIYSSDSGNWIKGVSIGWDALGFDLDLLQEEYDEDMPHTLPTNCPSYAYGCLYWNHVYEKSPKLIKLNISSLEFSSVILPDYYENHPVVVVEAGRGRIGLLKCMNYCSLIYSIRQNECDNADEQHPTETIIPLPHDKDCGVYFIVGSAAVEGYMFLRNAKLSAYFSLEIKTTKVERIWLSKRENNLIPYFGYPPFMSLRRI